MSELKPMMLEIGNLYEIEQDGVKEKYVCTDQSGFKTHGMAVVSTLRPVVKGKGILEIRLLGKPLTQQP